MSEPDYPTTVGVILAGGLARRLGGGDKVLRQVGGRAILDWQIERLAPQVLRIILNANGDPGRLARPGLTIVADTVAGTPGPLAGVLAALEWTAASAPDATRVVTVPGDAPFIPADLAARLHAAGGDRSPAHASSAGRTHPVIAMWPVAIRHALRDAIVRQGVRKVGAFLHEHGSVAVDWPAVPVDPFFNVNTPDDLQRADDISRSLAR